MRNVFIPPFSKEDHRHRTAVPLDEDFLTPHETKVQVARKVIDILSQHPDKTELPDELRYTKGIRKSAND